MTSSVIPPCIAIQWDHTHSLLTIESTAEVISPYEWNEPLGPLHIVKVSIS